MTKPGDEPGFVCYVPNARRLIDTLVDLGLISVEEEKSSWNKR